MQTILKQPERVVYALTSHVTASYLSKEVFLWALARVIVSMYKSLVLFLFLSCSSAPPGQLPHHGIVCAQDLYEKECEMQLQTRVQEETNERKNALEAYVYSLRAKLSDQLARFVTDDDKSRILQRLEEMEVHTLVLSI